MPSRPSKQAPPRPPTDHERPQRSPESFFQSLAAKLGLRRQAQPGAAASLEEIRTVMLGTLGPIPQKHFRRLWIRIRYAPDLDTLWHMRPELLQVLAREGSEENARRELEHITALFVPTDGRSARPHS